MSVDREDYLMIGYKMPYEVKTLSGDNFYNSIWDDKYMPFVEGWKDEEYRLIMDGMMGEYIVFGYPLDESDPYKGFNFNTIDFTGIEARLQAVRNKAMEVLSDIDFNFQKPEIFCFTHFH